MNATAHAPHHEDRRLEPILPGSVTTPRATLASIGGLEKLDDPHNLLDVEVTAPRFVLRENGRAFVSCGGECIIGWRRSGRGAAGMVYLVRDDEEGQKWDAAYHRAMRESGPHPGPRPDALYRLVISI